jgi:hypothetical protein
MYARFNITIAILDVTRHPVYYLKHDVKDGDWDHHYGVVVRVPGCRPRDPGVDSRRCHIF